MTALTQEQKEFIVRKLAAFYPPSDVAAAFAAQFPGVRCDTNTVVANDPRRAVVSPELFMLFRSERERLLDDPDAAPYADQKARLILLSNMVDRYKDNNQMAEARSVMQQIAAEQGIGGKTGAKAAPPLPADVAEEITQITRRVVHPTKDEPTE